MSSGFRAIGFLLLWIVAHTLISLLHGLVVSEIGRTAVDSRVPLTDIFVQGSLTISEVFAMGILLAFVQMRLVYYFANRQLDKWLLFSFIGWLIGGVVGAIIDLWLPAMNLSPRELGSFLSMVIVTLIATSCKAWTLRSNARSSLIWILANIIGIPLLWITAYEFLSLGIIAASAVTGIAMLWIVRDSMW